MKYTESIANYSYHTVHYIPRIYPSDHWKFVPSVQLHPLEVCLKRAAKCPCRAQGVNPRKCQNLKRFLRVGHYRRVRHCTRAPRLRTPRGTRAGVLLDPAQKDWSDQLAPQSAFMCVRCETCAASRLTTNQHAVMVPRWVSCPSKIITELHIPMGDVGTPPSRQPCAAVHTLWCEISIASGAYWDGVLGPTLGSSDLLVLGWSLEI